jgi:hypothetical protein
MALEDLRRELDPRLALDEQEIVALLVVGPPRVGGVDRRACDPLSHISLSLSSLFFLSSLR